MLRRETAELDHEDDRHRFSYPRRFVHGRVPVALPGKPASVHFDVRGGQQHRRVAQAAWRRPAKRSLIHAGAHFRLAGRARSGIEARCRRNAFSRITAALRAAPCLRSICE